MANVLVVLVVVLRRDRLRIGRVGLVEVGLEDAGVLADGVGAPVKLEAAQGGLVPGVVVGRVLAAQVAVRGVDQLLGQLADLAQGQAPVRDPVGVGAQSYLLLSDSIVLLLLLLLGR